MKEGFFYKAFTEAEHPRDEKGRFTEKGANLTYQKKQANDRLKQWANQDIFNEAFGISRENIFKKYNTKLEAIAVLPAKYIGIFDNVKDDNIYCSEAYFIDHMVNHHPEINLSDYTEMQSIIDTCEEIYRDEKNHSIIFTKNKNSKKAFFVLKYDKNGKIIFYKTFYYGRKIPSKLKKISPADIQQGNTSDEGGRSSISHSGKPNPAVSFSARSDNNIISQSDEKSSINEKLQKTLNKLNEVFLPRINIMEDYMGKTAKNRLNTVTVEEVLKGAKLQGVFDFEQNNMSKALVPAQGRNVQIKEEDINIEKMIRKRAQAMKRNNFMAAYGNSYDSMSRQKGLQSLFYDPLLLDTHAWGAVHTISPYHGRLISYRILRRVSEKAWVLNLCISNLIKKIRPFLKPSTEENKRGFRIVAKNSLKRKNGMTAAEAKIAETLESFILNTGDIEDASREDDLDKYVSKIVRDVCQLDQLSSELQYKRNGELCAFWAVDPATIEVALPYSEEQTGIKYVQVVNNIPYAYYGREDFIFDCMNPRTDLERAGYGYSVVEQAIDLITSSINTFMFNAGFFIENRLPRGILLLNGDADTDEIEDIEDYIVNLMSGPPSSQWRVPIIPAGKNTGGDGRRFEWVNLQGTNKEMEFQAWYDLQLSGIVGLFGFSMEDLGLHSQKSAPLIGSDSTPRIESSKSLVLGDMLSFLQKHFNRILSYKNPDYVFEFIGYERSDPRLTLDIDKEEVSGYKSLNEKRIEKGQKPLDFTQITNPADLPMNPQVIQAWQAVQQGSTSSGMVDEEEDDDNAFDENKDEKKDIEAGQEPEDNEGGKSEWDSLSKSINKAVKIVI